MNRMWAFVPFGLPVLVLMVLLPLALLAMMWHSLWGRAKRLGYRSVRAYLHATPHSDAQRRDAVDLVMEGVAWCLLGLLLRSFVLVGLVPLFYGGRKALHCAWGLGLVDDGDDASQT